MLCDYQLSGWILISGDDWALSVLTGLVSRGKLATNYWSALILYREQEQLR